MSRQGIDTKMKAEGRCRLCQRPSSVRRLTRHRLVPGSAGGTYRAVNCVPLCRPCHDLVDNRDLASRLQARKMLRASLWPSEVAYASRWRGWSFDYHYPVPARDLVLERRSGPRWLAPSEIVAAAQRPGYV